MPGFIHVRTRARILAHLLQGQTIPQIAAAEDIAQAIIAEFAGACGWPDPARTRRWAQYYATRADVDLRAVLNGGPEPSGARRAPRRRSTPAVDVEDLTSKAAAELAADLKTTPTPAAPEAETAPEADAEAEAETRTCVTCGTQFTPRARTQRFCDHRCREAKKREKRREEPRPTTAICQWCHEPFPVLPVGRIPQYCRPGHADMANRRHRAAAKATADTSAAPPTDATETTDMTTPPPTDNTPALPQDPDPAPAPHCTTTDESDAEVTASDESDAPAAAEDTTTAPAAPEVDLTDVPDLITRAWHLDRHDTAHALVALLSAVTTLRHTVTAAEAAQAEMQARAERAAHLTAERERLTAQLAELDAELATLTTAPDPAPTIDPDIPHPALAASTPVADVPEATVTHIGVLMVPPTRKGGRWGCGEPGCTRSFPTQRGVLTHAHRVHHQPHQEAS